MSQRAAILAFLVVLVCFCFCVVKGQEDPEKQISCRVHVVNNTASPDDNTLGHARSSLRVLSAADITDVSVILQVQHPDVAALEVTLTAAGTSLNRSKVLLKAPAAGVAAGSNMIQTIFSDYAPNTFPNTLTDAPYSSVYRPAEPLASLALGDGTAAGAGGSQGVWTLAVTDTAPDANRPLKLTGWELWLCGASNGPLFASLDPTNTTAFDGSADNTTPGVSIVKKRVAAPSKTDVADVMKSTYRKAQQEADPAAQIVDRVNSFLAKELAQKFDGVKPLLSKVSPELAAVLNSSIVGSITHLKGLPAILGYFNKGDRWELPTSEAAIKDFLDTIVHCHKDLYWCWQKTGLEGNFVQDFVATWEARAKPVANTWAAAHEQWIKSITNFEENNPELAGWGDVLFNSAISTLFRAAQLDAVATVAEAWTDTAIALALYLSPLRFAVNPRAFIVQTLSAAEIPLRAVFNLFKYLNDITDDDNNNDVAAITEFTRSLVAGTRETLDLLTLGVRTRAEAMQRSMVASAGGLAKGAAGMNEKVAKTLGAIDPRLGAIYNSSTDGINSLLRDIASSQQDAVSRYLKASTNRVELASQLDETLTLAGEVVVQLATNAGTAIKSAQTALDKVLPGPDVQKVLIDLRATIEGILSDAQKGLEKAVPVPEVREMDSLLRATVKATLDMLDESATILNEGEGAKAIQQELDRLAVNLMKASKTVNGVMKQVNDNFPGPMLNSTLEGIKQQGARTVTNIERMFKKLAKDYPNLDPAKFVSELGDLLGGLTANTQDLTTAFENLVPISAARELGKALPGTLSPVVDAVGKAVGDLPAVLKINPGKQNSDKLSELQATIGDTLEKFATSVRDIADALPNQPPVKAITDNLTDKTKELGKESHKLNKAVVDLVNAPSKVVEAGLHDFNFKLKELLDDLKGQQAHAADLGKALGKGPLADIAVGLNKTMAPLTKGFEELTAQLPKLPEIRDVVNKTLLPRLEGLGVIVKQASDAALQATAAANQGGLQTLAGLLNGLVNVLVQGQLQLATLLNAAGKAGEQLQVLAAPADLEGPLKGLDMVLSNVTKGIASDLEAALKSLAPPEAVVQGLVRPLAANLDKGLGDLLKGVNNTANKGLPGLLNGTAGLVKDLADGASAVLGLPAPAGRPMPMPAGRHLLAVEGLATPLTGLPADFNAEAFRGAIVNALQSGATQFANSAVVAANGRPGASTALGALQKYVGTLTGAAKTFEGFLAGLPRGKILSVILDSTGGGKNLIQSLLGLQAGLKSAAPGQQGPVMTEIGSVLTSLGGSDGAGVDATSAVQAAVQLAAKQLLPNAEALLAGFRTQLAALLGSGSSTANNN